ncbi:winged helix DNA-binding domain-containing protein [Nocardioides sp. HDW12B]|uniref:DNA glycosylase AlkZ-like family protein n=1 Tax=Nocardioides sp. HDW12B TaxID=2714939 RepID=UPI0014094888|nr:crosslink repair DNA glycosylase YcaQ family protein [Nocardioides sp. HDW12B]QIK65537.1 winged helix DNA-binding domain-containing protein [Nocardioides sp. HDW12B]
MVSPTPEDMARWRLHHLRLTGAQEPDPAAVVDHLLGVQAENVAQATWAIGTRCGADLGAVERALDDDVVRTHVLRPTWHFVRPHDLGWLLDLGRERMLPLWRRSAEVAGVEVDEVRAAVAVVERVLSAAGDDGGPGHLTRAELAEALARAGTPLTGMGLGHVLGYAETEGLICGGIRRGDHTYALLEDRAPRRASISREEALARIARRYVVGHGPATDRDLAYWATLTLTEARAGLHDAGLDTLEVGGTTYWCDGEPEPGAFSPRAHLLQILDEAYRGFPESRRVLDREGLLVTGRERAIGMVLVDGQVVGDMRRTVTEHEVRFELTAWRTWTPEEVVAVERAAVRYGAFLGREPVVRLASR